MQPFGNSLVTMTLTGDQIDTVLEQQFTGAQPECSQVSDGFTYTWAPAMPAGQGRSGIDHDRRIAVDPAAGYRVTVNSFLADGGDNYHRPGRGTDRLGGEVDLDAFVAYFEANSPVARLGRRTVTTAP